MAALADPVDPTSPSPPPAVQEFCSQNGQPFPSVHMYKIGHFGDLFVYWSDVQNAFSDTHYLMDIHDERVFFEVVNKDDKHEL
jgi:hypothetical protein